MKYVGNTYDIKIAIIAQTSPSRVTYGMSNVNIQNKATTLHGERHTTVFYA